MKISIIYWSSTGNTEKMAALISEGAKTKGAEVDIKNVTDSSIDDINTADITVFGCPAMGSEILEEDEFEPFMASVEDKIGGKKVALFGSYDWGDGEWMRDWHDRMKQAGAIVLAEGLIVTLAPQGDDADLCRKFGETIASK